MREIPLTQGKFAIVDDEDFELLSHMKWQINNYGYAVRHVWNKQFKKYETLIMHHLIMGKPERGYEIDHIDRNPLNNTRENLRVVTHQQNNFNKGKNKNNTTGYKGVYLDRRKYTWYAKIEVNRKQIFLGSARSIEEACKLRADGERKYHAI